MAGSLNKVMLIGNLGRDPEVRHTQDGNPIATLNIATAESWKDKQTGEKKEKTEWHRVVIFGKVAEVAQKYLKKGSSVYIEGKMVTRKWTDQQGQDRYTTEVQVDGFSGSMTMLGGKNEGSQEQYQRDAAQAQQPQSTPATQAEPPFDDDIPF